MPSASLGRIALSIPQPQSKKENGEVSSDNQSPNMKMKDPGRGGKRQGVKEKNGGKEPRHPFGRRGGNRSLFPPLDALVIDLIDNGTDDPAWLVRLPDAKGQVAKWFTSIHKGTSSLSETVYSETVHDGGAVAYEFENDPFLRWLGSTRILVTTAENEVLIFLDESVLEQLPALLVSEDSISETSSNDGGNGESGEEAAGMYLAYADLTPELVLALLAFESGQDRAGADLTLMLKPLIDRVSVCVERNGPKLQLTSEASNCPANLIGLSTLLNAVYLLMAS